MARTQLTERQKRFVEAFAACGNATEAARTAQWECEGAGEFYVYLLVDPRDDAIFYVGKGTGRRVHAHASEAANRRVTNAPKYQRICAINAAGLRLCTWIFFRTDDEGEAFAVERELIAAFRQRLCNIVGGVVTNEQAEREWVKAKAEKLLEEIKPYPVWLAGLRPSTRALISSYGETPLEYYAWNVKFLVLASQGLLTDEV